MEGSEEMKQFIHDSKKTITFLGVINKKGDAVPKATGFFVQVQGIFHLVTAKHVVMDMKTGDLMDKELFAFFNRKAGGVTSVSIKKLKRSDETNWIFHSDDQVDIAIIPFRLSKKADDVLVIPYDSFLGIESLSELYDIFFLSFQPGAEFGTRIIPIIRGGIISRINEDKTLFVDAAAFPGNSGSPVFLKPSPIVFNEEVISIGNDPLGGKFIGVIGAYIPYEEVAVSVQTGLPRVVFQENTGLSKVWSVTYLKQIIESAEFVKQLNSIQTKPNIHEPD